jgi:glutamyl-Q tRNA(Asp) synthetase
MNQDPPYIGRFAPSPTGDLHFGSLVAAVASYLQARCNGGRWLVRIEDIDPPREVAGSATRVLNDLARLGMKPDRPVLYQSTRISAYKSAREFLRRSGQAYYCNCSRKSLPSTGIYPGTCRAKQVSHNNRTSLRVNTNDRPIRFSDALQGEISKKLRNTTGDFVIWRADQLPAYQLAVVVDDAYQRITEVVRGADLLDSTPRQIYLQELLDLPTPSYVHLPVATVDGNKLSKREDSDPVAALEPAKAVHQALRFLGHQAPRSLDLEAVWAWALDHWKLKNVPAEKTMAIDGINGR